MTLSSAPAEPAQPGAPARAAARRHSRHVRVLRLALPAMILALIGLLAAYVVAQSVREVARAANDTPIQIRMISPHFIGRDDLGREFNLTAREAVRDDLDMKRVRLTAPVLELYSTPNAKRLTADRGLYDEGTRLLKLTGHVYAVDSTGSALASSEALVDTRAGTVTGLSPLSAKGPQGDIQAGSYSVAQRNGVVVMHGGVHAVLRGK